MENLNELMEIASKLPEQYKEAAISLVEQMSSTLDGIGDEPVQWRPQFLKLVQGTTDRSTLPKGTAIGDFVLGETKVEQPLKFIPIRIWNSRQYWDPDQTNNKMLCSSPDAQMGAIGRECKTCEHQVWVEGKGSDCGKSKSMIAISSDMSKVFLVNFSKSNFKIGNELETQMKRAGVASYMRTYGLSSKTSTTAKNVENFNIEVLDEKARRTPVELLEFLKALFDRVSADRKAQLEAFYKMATEKRDTQALSHSPAGLIESSASTQAVEVEVEESGNQSPLAKNYSI